jgi:ferrochelatase
MNKLKVKWGIDSNWQLALIFLVFSITGSLSVYVKALIFTAVGIDANTTLFLIIPLYLITIIPIYYVILIIIGTLFGQYQFFLSFEKKVFRKNISS